MYVMLEFNHLVNTRCAYIHNNTYIRRACREKLIKNSFIIMEMTGEGDTGRKQHACQTGDHCFFAFLTVSQLFTIYISTVELHFSLYLKLPSPPLSAPTLFEKKKRVARYILLIGIIMSLAAHIGGLCPFSIKVVSQI